ncbi:unnamed protein product [Gongylonema pulchrum]|uniref:SAP domain-containing protein n=1 Tax=Gongylonema pulchrum TaxID=637853 RepID=A0A183DCR3_9BILA|nr:unnamed protein product [Gongylonema pulchrum]
MILGRFSHLPTTVEDDEGSEVVFELVDTYDADSDIYYRKLRKCRARAKKYSRSPRYRLSLETLALLRRRRAMIAFHDTGVKYKLLCKEIRKKMKEDYDKFRTKRLAQKRSIDKAWDEVAELRQELMARDLEAKGVKSVLCSRLQEALDKEKAQEEGKEMEVRVYFQTAAL